MKRFCPREKSPLAPLLAILLILAACFLLLRATAALSALSEEERLRTAETAVRRAAVQCYAVEGIYPPDLQYMKERYGLQVDESAYLVDYRCFASNLMPTITVVRR